MADNKKGAITETLKEYVEYIGIIIRYTASGFIGLMILIIAEAPIDEKVAKLIKLFPWMIFVVAVIIGITAYSVHHTLMDTFFNFLSVRINKIFNKDKSDDKKINLFKLKRERRSRRANNDLLQKDFDGTFSLLNYLYCSSYLFILIPVFCHVLDLWQNSHIHWWHIAIIGSVLLLLTFFGDILITKEEFEEDFGN